MGGSWKSRGEEVEITGPAFARPKWIDQSAFRAYDGIFPDNRGFSRLLRQLFLIGGTGGGSQ